MVPLAKWFFPLWMFSMIVVSRKENHIQSSFHGLGYEVISMKPMNVGPKLEK